MVGLLNFQQNLKMKEEEMSSKMKELKDNYDSVNTRYQEAVKERECVENHLQEEREKNETLLAELKNEVSIKPWVFTQNHLHLTWKLSVQV